jgi:fido (protein-threonine AMPylation protein)
MATDPHAERREGALAANRIRELAENPLRGNFDVDHLRAVHAYIFQDLPHHQPGQMRNDTSGWSKARALEGEINIHEVHYAHDNIARRAETTLRNLGGQAALTGLPADAFAARMAQLYGDLDHIHPFQEGNSRTLREFTRSLALAAGYDLNWTSTNVDAAERNRLYIARDIAVLERAFPGLTPQRGMETNDRAEYEASLALPALRRVPGAPSEAIIREGLTPAPGAHQEPGQPAEPQPAPRPWSVPERALAALARHQDATAPPAVQPLHTPIADRTHQTQEPPPTPGTPRPQSDTSPDPADRATAACRPSRGPSP